MCNVLVVSEGAFCYEKEGVRWRMVFIADKVVTWCNFHVWSALLFYSNSLCEGEWTVTEMEKLDVGL